MNRFCKFFISFFFLCGALNITAQNTEIDIQNELEQIIEDFSEAADDEADISILTENLQYYAENPLNINTASAEELHELYFLNDFQVAMLLDYQSKQGEILSFFELLYLPGFSKREVQLLEKFSFCGEQSPAKIPVERVARNLRHDILIRGQRILEEQEGYQAIPDSVLWQDPDKSRYLGSREKLYCRYLVSSYNRFDAGLVMEKDAGENFFKESNAAGFDFYSGHIAIAPKSSPIRKLVLGDYHLQAGQGVLLWSSYAFGKSGMIDGIAKSGELVKLNRSVEENMFFRGAVAQLTWKNFSFTPYFSSKLCDASLSDSSLAEQSFLTFTTTGLHNTPSQLEKEKTIRETVYGLMMHYNTNRLQVGINTLVNRFNRTLLESDKLYQNFYFHGKTYSGISANYKYLASRMQVFGEFAYSNSAPALLNGALFFLHTNLSVGIVHRYYHKVYYSRWANSLRENSRVSNEQGLYFGTEGRFGRHSFSVYSDLFSFPWLQYRVNSPSAGYEIMGQWNTQFERVNLYLRYKREVKPLNDSVEMATYQLTDRQKENLKLRSVLPVGQRLNLQNRVEFSRVAFGQETPSWGYFLCQDLVYRSIKWPVELSSRIAWFQAEEYENRFYVYERDLLYAASSQMHYGKGWRWMAMIRWDIWPNFSFWFKIGQSIYPGKTAIGSGLNEIAGNHKTEVRMQIKTRF